MRDTSATCTVHSLRRTIQTY